MDLKLVRQRIWRAVEAQHHVSTLRLVDHSIEDHAVLESILEESKPVIPAAARRLHYLLATPFRYPSPYGSRFRASGDPGVFYGASERRTACAELGYWRWRFLSASEALDELPATAQTLFQASVEGLGIDLLSEKMSPDDYTATQAWAREARTAGVAVILYGSVRDPQHGVCTAVLTPAAFRPKRLLAQETWFLSVTSKGVVWTREREQFAFRFSPHRQ